VDAAITSYIDVAQLVLYAFWIFFFGLIIYLRREDKREGYPLDSDRSRRAPRVQVVGFPPPPPPKTFRLPHGEGVREAPREEAPPQPIEGTTLAFPFPGEPLRPTGDPMREAIGPASYADRQDVPDLTLEGGAKIVPMRVASEFWVPDDDPDPRGMSVVAADNRVAGTVCDVWVDRSEPRILFFEVELSQPSGAANDAESEGSGADATSEEGEPATASRALVPVGFARVQAGRGQIRVNSIRAHQFAHVPQPASAEQVTRREEDKITAYFGSGHLYADPARQEPLV